ncbi:uncharacterized protein [Triticum aestivum]|uniref:uncharacterized protein isoform X2 n=1 Tax=Triticum aestivum TaxID=4565 RepID=UPI0008432B81|nr:uncharacterized protein LOC123104674 isoform X2 [Triticum aestivum]
MVSELGLAPPAKRPTPSPTTITAIGDDLLREIFLLLPSLPSLVRAALACRTFLDAVRSSPAFRRRFRALHPPQLLGFFIDSCRSNPFVPFRSRSDPDLAAAVRGADFLLTRLPEDSDSSPGWHIEACHGGCVVLVNLTTYQEARMICVQHRNKPQQVPARLAVFSPATREWQILPWVETPQPSQPEDDGDIVPTFLPGTQLKGFVYRRHTSKAYVLVLNTATMQFSRVDLPPFLVEMDPTLFSLDLGHSKDGKLCLAVIEAETLIVWLWRADDDVVEKWMQEGTFPLSTFVDDAKISVEDYTTVQIEAVIEGFVYVSTKYDAYTESLHSLCLETAKLNKLFDNKYTNSACPYIMAWPPSLVGNEEDFENKVTGENVANDGPAGPEEAPSVLVTALRSYKEALINDDGAKVAEIELFLLSIEDEKKSLAAQLTTARDYILRISADIDGYRRRPERER